MDYEKKYKESLALMVDCTPDEDGYVHVRPQDIFPELRELDDEGIRKVIYGLISIQPSQFFDNGFSKYEMLAWLEKQDGQRPTLPKWKYKKDHTSLLRDSIILNKYGCVAKSPSGAIVSDVWVLDYDELAKLPKEEIEKQGEQKPSDEDMKEALRTEYEKGRADAIAEIRKKWDDSKKKMQEVISFLESLRLKED